MGFSPPYDRSPGHRMHAAVDEPFEEVQDMARGIQAWKAKGRKSRIILKLQLSSTCSAPLRA
ncbi:protein of unknown function (plasmid) [Cupriavidus taiwanensis]|uniref:Uncharacterized protein n=1 Tax=Cupriavidus taiwanensis TaxID=164546 RepID=A0A375EDZ4_9BURK|nr:protein of unknown function [Cupriavidus taiwanensis]SOZ72169.1 protein of unknown function [Cupriavidus taiwanensis]SOZ74467.1 protein of unknown function [Cupriavidus taiwanensis]SPA11386.1 protein of unknown function [Cupriavidus taiwanensis]SPD48736.1 protein of unknown function [Cupriavidus taiwanensis]